MRVVVAIVSAIMMLACQRAPAGRVSSRTQAIIYDEDGREEVYAIASPRVRALVESSVVALVPKSSILTGDDGELLLEGPTRSELGDMACSNEPFADQPAEALCTGVLVDWDLILTAGHCTHALSIDALAAVFGYYYRSPSELALAHDGVFDLAEVVHRRIVREQAVATRDYAWIRLARPAGAPYRPVAIRRSSSTPVVGAPITYAGSYDGSPIKVDRGASVHELQAPEADYFVADTDSARGGSGGPAFDQELALIGTLSRGGPDRVAGATCSESNHVSSALAEERFSRARTALDDLCANEPGASSLCREECADPCLALAPHEAGCTLSARPSPARGPYGLALLWLVLWRRRRRRRASMAICLSGLPTSRS